MGYIKSTRQGNKVVFDSQDRFGDTHTQGAQHKGMSFLDDEKVFVKLDDIHPNKGVWEPPYDFNYSSISEAIVSAFVDACEPDEKFDNVFYDLTVFEQNGKLSSGSISKPFLKENEVERLLSSEDTLNTRPLMSIEDYRDHIVDVKTEDRMKKLIDVFSQTMPEDDVKHFLIQQAGFDLLTGNQDRLHNPSNFVIAINAETGAGRLINMDYGRCLQMNDWGDMYEANMSTENEFYQETVSDSSKNFINKTDSILSGKTLNESLEYLTDNGFQPFKVDIEKLQENFENLETKFDTYEIQCRNFAHTKLDAFKVLLESDKLKGLWQEADHMLTNDMFKDLETNLEL